MKRPDTNKFTLNEDNKRKSNRHPSHRGVIDVEGTLYWIDGWYNEGEYGDYIKGNVKRITDEDLERYFSDNGNNKPSSQTAPRSVAPPPMKPPVVIEDDFDDELPF